MERTHLPAPGSPGAFHPNNAAAARSIINSEGRTNLVVIYYQKKDGSIRRLVGYYDGAMSPAPDQMVMWDVEKGGYRTVNLRTVDVVKIMGCSRTYALEPEAAADRPPQPKKTLAELKAELADFC